jgi:hypothetical protein
LRVGVLRFRGVELIQVIFDAGIIGAKSRRLLEGALGFFRVVGFEMVNSPIKPGLESVL